MATFAKDAKKSPIGSIRGASAAQSRRKSMYFNEEFSKWREDKLGEKSIAIKKEIKIIDEN